MSELIKNQLLNAWKNSSKVKITLLDDFHHYGFVRDVDNDFVLIDLEHGDKQVTIRFSNIKEVVVYG